MTHTTTRPWETKRTAETRKVEDVLTAAAFEHGRRIPLQLSIDPRPGDR